MAWSQDSSDQFCMHMGVWKGVVIKQDEINIPDNIVCGKSGQMKFLKRKKVLHC